MSDYSTIQEQVQTGYFDNQEDNFIMTDPEIRKLSDIEDKIYDIAGDYPHFTSLEDGRNFLKNLKHYVNTEGYRPGKAYDQVMQDMDL